MRRPERRNRKSGTRDFGWRAQNKMGIPNSWQDRDGEYRDYAERIAPETIEKIDVNGHEITFIREATRDGAHHACSVADVVHLLSLVPERDLEDLDIVAFRQPTRKQAAHQHCWGRLFYHANIAKVEGSAIVLEAMDLPSPIQWRRSMNIEQQSELDRLRADGHQIEETPRHFVIHPTQETLRNTVLYRTVLHELGHWVDYMQKCVWTETLIDEDAEGEGNAKSEEIYFSRPSREREDFAHRYADELGAKLRANELIPFDPR